MVGLASELDPAPFAPILRSAPTPSSIATLIAEHYHAGGDPIEHAWRAQSDRFLELPDELLAPEVLAVAAHVIVPELRLIREGVPSMEAPRVVLRRVRRHARRDMARAQAIDGLEPRAFVYAVNLLLEEQGTPLRFVPLAAIPGRRAWLGTSFHCARELAAHGAVAPGEPWCEYARFSSGLALAS